MSFHYPTGRKNTLTLTPTRAVMAGLYIHIPFCRQACHYCDFHFSTRQETRGEMIRAIAAELRLQREYVKGERIQTIYFGGGTPSLLTAPELDLILSSIHDHYTIVPLPEITLEANPDDLSPEKLSQIRTAGINRLSIGIQSFDDEVLRFLNRVHDSASSTRCVEDARKAGFTNISIDLMYSITGQSPAMWKDNIAKAMLLAPEHISAYSLTLEEKTVFGKWQRSGKLRAVDEETAARQFEVLMDTLGEHGYEHYEISNFCLPGLYSRHNSGYWRQEVYLGAGPSAHSYDHVSRQANVSNNARYVSTLATEKIPFEREVLTAEDKINEYIFTTLRTSWGCDLTKLKRDFHWDLLQHNAAYLTTLQEKEFVTIHENILRLTRSGKLVADQIASDLFAGSAKPV